MATETYCEKNLLSGRLGCFCEERQGRCQIKWLNHLLKRVEQQIADATESLNQHGWPEIANELAYLEGRRAELTHQLEDLTGWDEFGYRTFNPSERGV